MSHLIQNYTVCPVVFEFSIYFSLDLIFLKKFADLNFVVCFLVVKELKSMDTFHGKTALPFLPFLLFAVKCRKNTFL